MTLNHSLYKCPSFQTANKRGIDNLTGDRNTLLLGGGIQRTQQMVGTVKDFQITTMLTYPIIKKKCQYLNNHYTS